MTATPQLARIRILYRRFAPMYDVFRALWSRLTRPIEDDLDRLFRDRVGPQTRVLELAPGTGINIERLLRCSPSFTSYLGIDASPHMLARARARTGDDSRIELRVGDVTELPSLAEGPFDFIVSTWLLSHLVAPTETVLDALAMLAPGGTAVFVFFTKPRSRVLRGVLRALHGPFSYELIDPEPFHELPDLERIDSCAGRMATLAVFRAATDGR